MAVAGGERDAAKGGEGRGDVGGSDGLEIFARLNAKAHENDGDVLIVIIRNAVTGSVGAWLACRSAVHEPVRFWHDKEIAAAARKVAKSEGPNQAALRGGEVSQFVGAINGRDALGDRM